MANLSNFKLPKRIAVLYNDLYWLSVKLHEEYCLIVKQFFNQTSCNAKIIEFRC